VLGSCPLYKREPFHLWETSHDDSALATGTHLFLMPRCTLGQQTESTAPRTINLHEAVDLALKHNHVVRIAALHVEEEQHAKEVARSAYLPTLRNDSIFAHASDTQFIAIPAGGLGVVSGTEIPPRQFTINQGDKNFITSGT